MKRKDKNKEPRFVTKAESDTIFAKWGLSITAVWIAIRVIIWVAGLVNHNIGIDYPMVYDLLFAIVSLTFIFLTVFKSGKYLMTKRIVLKKGVCKKGRIVDKEDKIIDRAFCYRLLVSIDNNLPDSSMLIKSEYYRNDDVLAWSGINYCDVYCYEGKYILDNFRETEDSGQT